MTSDSLKTPTHLAEYLFTRIHQIGIRSVHGVPGDYNLTLLDYVPKAELFWVGNCNELNAGYAADGYARVKGISAVVTTFGVGELSAINAIAGAYSEQVPVIHIVGTPTTIAQKGGMLLHHSLGNGDFNVFTNMARSVACETVQLNDLHNAGALIDHALKECYIKSRPVYIAVPVDMVSKPIEGEGLKTPIDLSYPTNDTKKEDYVVDLIVKQLYAAQSPVILVDGCAIRHRVLEEVHDLMEKSGLPTFVTPMGKSAVNETLPNFGGVYAGNGSLPDIKKCVESSDLVLSIGAIKSDINTAGFSYDISKLATIDFHSSFIEVGYSNYAGVAMKGVLRKVIQRLDMSTIKKVQVPTPFIEEKDASDSQRITHAWRKYIPRLS